MRRAVRRRTHAVPRVFGEAHRRVHRRRAARDAEHGVRDVAAGDHLVLLLQGHHVLRAAAPRAGLRRRHRLGVRAPARKRRVRASDVAGDGRRARGVAVRRVSGLAKPDAFPRGGEHPAGGDVPRALHADARVHCGREHGDAAALAAGRGRGGHVPDRGVRRLDGNRLRGALRSGGGASEAGGGGDDHRRRRGRQEDPDGLRDALRAEIRDVYRGGASVRPGQSRSLQTQEERHQVRARRGDARAPARRRRRTPGGAPSRRRRRRGK